MKLPILSLTTILTLTFGSLQTAKSQTIPKEELIFLTSEWKGETLP